MLGMHMLPLSATCAVHDDTHEGADEQQEACSRLEEESRQTLLHGFAVTDEVQCTARDPDQAEHGSAGIAQVNCTKP